LSKASHFSDQKKKSQDFSETVIREKATQASLKEKKRGFDER
jgi:hypothetical protein